MPSLVLGLGLALFAAAALASSETRAGAQVVGRGHAHDWDRPPSSRYNLRAAACSGLDLARLQQPMVVSPTARSLLVSGLLLGVGTGLLVAAALAASGSRAATASPVKDGGTLRVMTVLFDFIDPALAQPTLAAPSQAIWPAEDASCALLLRYRVARPPARDFRLVPEVAAGFPAVSRDGRTYTYRVRKGYRFSTGAPVMAASYAREIARILNPAMRSPAARYLQDVAGVKVSGDRLIIRLKKRVPDLPARLAMPFFCPVPVGLPVEPEGAKAPLPGSGPYYIAEFVRGSRVVLERNRFYRGSRPHHLDRFVIELSGDSETNTRKVEAGQADLDLLVSVTLVAEVGKRYGVNKGRFFSFPSPSIFYVLMNTSRPLFRNNPRLRQAVNFALDRPAIMRTLGPLAYVGAATDDYLPPVVPGYVDAHLYPLKHPDFKQARALARGHTRSGKAVHYACDNLPPCFPQGQIIQANLKRIGIDVEIKTFPLSILGPKLATRGEPFDLAVLRYDLAWVDPYQYVNLLFDGRTIQATGNVNLSYFNSPRYNRLIDRVGRLNGRARYDSYGRLAVDLARNAAPLAAFAVRNDRFLVSARVGCVRTGAYSGLDLAGLCLK